MGTWESRFILGDTMVQILPEVPSFGTQFARSIGTGLGAGISKGADLATQMALEKYKQKQRKNLISEIEGGQSQGIAKDLQGQPQEDMRQKFLEALPQIEQAAGRELSPQDLDMLWDKMSQSQMQQQPAQQQHQETDPFLKAKKYAAAGEHELARTATEEAKLSEKLKAQERKESFGLAKPTLERGRELVEDLPYKENALSTIKDAIQSGNLGMFSLDNLAELTGIEGLRTPEGAAFKTASKEFFLGNISRVGAKGLNQMMEKIVYEMSPLIGRSTEANLSVAEILGAESDVTRKEAELINEIGSAYKDKHGQYPDDLAHRVYKALRPYAQQRQKDALAEVDRIKTHYQPKNKQGILMYDPAGNLRRVPYGNKKEAMKEGYRMP